MAVEFEVIAIEPNTPISLTDEIPGTSHGIYYSVRLPCVGEYLSFGPPSSSSGRVKVVAIVHHVSRKAYETNSVVYCELWAKDQDGLGKLA